MARIVVTLRRFEKRRLLKWAAKQRDPGVRLRVRIVLLYAEGFGCDRIAHALKVAPTTATRTARRFLREGLAGLVDGRQENGTPKVDADLAMGLVELVGSVPTEFGLSRPTWTRELLAIALKRKTGVQVSEATVGRMLRGLRARRGRPRPIVVCPWPRKRKERCLRAIRRRLRRLRNDELAFFEDEVDIHLNPKIGSDWMLEGQQKLVVTPGQNQKRYIAGALGVDGTTLIWATARRKNSALFIALLQRMLTAFPSVRRFHLVLDNYVIHSSGPVKRFLARHTGRFVLHFLPPYSPNENRIERLWLELHANVTRNHTCKSMRELMSRVLTFLRRQSKSRSRENRGALRWRVRAA